jgi:methoxymalonate biosynthesis protein
MNERRDDARTLVAKIIGDRAGEWDMAGRIPLEPLRQLGAEGLLCAEVAESSGGLGFSSQDNGELIACIGEHCGSVRSVATCQGMAAWTVRRFGDAGQRAAFLRRLTGGELAAMAFSEPGAGSDLSAMRTEIVADGDTVVVSGHKVWVTGAKYADLLVVFGRFGDGAAAVVVPASAAGVRLENVPGALGCRAGGHANVRLDAVRVPVANLLRGAGQPLGWLVTTALTYGRLSVAWGCVGILRACLGAATAHVKSRKQFGRLLADHQMIRRHIAELLAAEQVATRVCEHASRQWDAGSPEMVTASVVAKHVAAGHAATGSSTAVQVLGSAGVLDGHVVARAYRDAKLMEIIEGSNEISQLMLADHALGAS